MNFNKKEIIAFLELYSISKIKTAEIKNNIISNENFSFFSFIVENVEQWLSFLEEDEIEIIKDRHFKNMTFDNISIKFFYANHSSIIRKYNSIIEKIRRNIN